MSRAQVRKTPSSGMLTQGKVLRPQIGPGTHARLSSALKSPHGRAIGYARCIGPSLAGRPSAHAGASLQLARRTALGSCAASRETCTTPVAHPALRGRGAQGTAVSACQARVACTPPACCRMPAACDSQGVPSAPHGPATTPYGLLASFPHPADIVDHVAEISHDHVHSGTQTQERTHTVSYISAKMHYQGPDRGPRHYTRSAFGRFLGFLLRAELCS